MNNVYFIEELVQLIVVSDARISKVFWKQILRLNKTNSDKMFISLCPTTQEWREFPCIKRHFKINLTRETSFRLHAKKIDILWSWSLMLSFLPPLIDKTYTPKIYLGCILHNVKLLLQVYRLAFLHHSFTCTGDESYSWKATLNDNFWETFHHNFIFSLSFCRKSIKRKSSKIVYISFC